MGRVADLLDLAEKVHRAGHLQQAEQLYRQVVLLNPAFPGAWQVWYLLGAACQSQGKYTEAEACLQQSLRIKPDFVDAHDYLGVTFAHQAKYSQAADSFRRVLEIQPNHADACFHLGLALSSQGKFFEAEPAFREAVRLRPNDVKSYTKLAYALFRQKKIDEAMATFQQALRLQPNSAEAHYALSVALVDLGKLDEAVVQLHEVLRLKPDFAGAYGVLSELFKEGHYQLLPAEIDSIRKLLAEGRLGIFDHSALQFALAFVADKLGNYDEAFLHYRQGNEAKQQAFQQFGTAFDIDKHRQFIDERIEAYTPELLRQVASFGHTSEVPVFIVGVPRSGTSLVNHILSAHPQATAPGEFLDIPNMVAELPRTVGRSGKLSELLPRLNREMVQSLAERYLSRLAQLGGTAVRITDKLPENYFHLGFISVLFPQARIIHCRRNPLDNCLSCYMHNFSHLRFIASLESLGLYYREYERIMAHWQRVLPIRIYEVQYEDLIARQEIVSRELIAFCGLPWNDSCLAFHRNPRAVHTASRMQVRQPIYRSSVNRWRKYSSYLAPLLKALGEPAEPQKARAL
jgi:tetratricopeptide (TPR) repeat protein